MTHTDKNKFSKKSNAQQSSRNNKTNHVHANVQKSRKDLSQMYLTQQKQASKPVHTISFKDFEKQKKDKSLNSAS